MDTIQAGAAGGDNAAGALSNQAELSQQLMWSAIVVPSNPLSCRYTVRCNRADIAVSVSWYNDIEP